MPLVSLANVQKSYGTHRVINGISLDVNTHEVACLIGGSGSGKSTLLRCINGLETVNEGHIEFDGEIITDPGVNLDAVRLDLVIVFQSYNLFPQMSVAENVMLAPRHVLKLGKPEAKELALDMLAKVGLKEKADAYPDRLSGGQQQRVAIARALAMSPKLLLLDEVTSALDPELVEEVLNLIRQLARDGMTMILATHEMQFAREVASNVYFLADGQVHEFGPPAEFFGNPQKPRTRAFLKRVLGTA
ncbi:MAG: amino acid ABC transporter ATP-binding protein [Microlunatus sp.]